MKGAFLPSVRPYRLNSRTCCILRKPAHESCTCKKKKALILAHCGTNLQLPYAWVSKHWDWGASLPLLSTASTHSAQHCTHSHLVRLCSHVPVLRERAGVHRSPSLQTGPSSRPLPCDHQHNDRVSVHKVPLWQTFTVW